LRELDTLEQYQLAALRVEIQEPVSRQEYLLQTLEFRDKRHYPLEPQVFGLEKQ